MGLIRHKKGKFLVIKRINGKEKPAYYLKVYKDGSVAILPYRNKRV